MTSDRLSITWPTRFRPEVATLVSRAELKIDAPAETIWARLIRAAEWPDWYRGASDVSFELWDGPDLRAGTMFDWTTFDVRLHSVVNEFEPVSRIGWHAHSEGVEAWHAWVLEPTDDGGTIVVTEESLLGVVPRFAVGLDDAITEQHALWLDRLAIEAAKPTQP
jgi:uncharacterized protein YndB with AHSA1/START domain